MPVYQFNVQLNGISGLAEDKYINTWHFWREDAAPVTDFDNVRDMLFDYYSTTAVGSPPRTFYCANALTTTVNVTAYNLEEEKPRAPVYESVFPTMTWGSGEPLPNEVALCMSFEADKASGEIQARKRNRIYLGPFRSSFAATGGRPTDNDCQYIVNAGSRLVSASQASATWDWCVYSPTSQEHYDVAHIWVDNAFDTQRRRGIKPSVRKEWRA